MRNFYFLVFLGFLISLNAVWTDNNMENTLISDVNSRQETPKISYDDSGNLYCSFFSYENNNYNMRLQYFDWVGNYLWSESGSMVSDHTSMSWLTDYDLTVDNYDNAILVFSDYRTSALKPYIYKISSNGDDVWGSDGLFLSSSESDFEASPVCAVLSDNSVVTTWQRELPDRIELPFQRIGSDGEYLWDMTGEVLASENEENYTWPQIVAVEDSKFIVVWCKDTGPYYAPIRHIYAQKFDQFFNQMWEEDVPITTAGGISAWTHPKVKSDGMGGVLVDWYDDRDEDNIFEIWTQRVDGSGEIMFDENGLELTTLESNNHAYPHSVYLSESNQYAYAWTEFNSSQTQFGIYSQLITAQGELLWNDSGFELLPVNSINKEPIALRETDEGFIMIYSENFAENSLNNYIKALSIDTDGNEVWDSPTVISAVGSEKMHYNVSKIKYDQIVTTWQDNRTTPTKVYAQNIHMNGSLGVEETSGLITVPDDFDSIQQAINVSSDGDTVLVMPGEYSELLNLQGKAITLCSNYLFSQDPNDIANTVIDGSHSDSVIKMHNGEDSLTVICGFTIKNGYTYDGGGVDCDETVNYPKIINNIFLENWSNRGAGIKSDGSVYIANNTFENNFVTVTGSGIYCTGGASIIENNTFLNNEETAIYSESEDNLEIRGNYFIDNVSTLSSCLDFTGHSGTALIESNILTGNSSDSSNVFTLGNLGFFVLANNTIVDNFNAEALEITNDDILIANNIFCNEQEDEIILEEGCNSLITNNLIPNFEEGNNNLDTDPEFEEEAENLYVLSDSSLCIGAGINSVEHNGYAYSVAGCDILGEPRPQPSNTVCDLGAVENSLSGPVSLNENEISINETSLGQNYPNPICFKTNKAAITHINFSLSKSQQVSLKIYNIRGKLVKSLIDSEKPAGFNKIIWDCKDEDHNRVASGVYFYKLKTETKTFSKKLLILK